MLTTRRVLLMVMLAASVACGCHKKTEPSAQTPATGTPQQLGAARAERSGMAAGTDGVPIADAPEAQPRTDTPPAPDGQGDPQIGDTHALQPDETPSAEPEPPIASPQPPEPSKAPAPSKAPSAPAGEDVIALKAGPFEGQVRPIPVNDKALSGWGIPAYQGAKGIEPVGEEFAEFGQHAVALLSDDSIDKVAKFYETKLAGWGDLKKQLVAMAQMAAAQQKKEGGSPQEMPDFAAMIDQQLPGHWRVSPDQKNIIGVVRAENTNKTAIVVIHAEEGAFSALMGQAGGGAPMGMPGGAKGPGAAPRKGP